MSIGEHLSHEDLVRVVVGTIVGLSMKDEASKIVDKVLSEKYLEKSFVIKTIKGMIVEDDGKHVMSDGRICIQCEHNTLLYKLLEVLEK